MYRFDLSAYDRELRLSSALTGLTDERDIPGIRARSQDGENPDDNHQFDQGKPVVQFNSSHGLPFV